MDHCSEFTVKEIQLRTTTRWTVSGSYRGQQIRKRFASRKEAQSFADDYNDRLASDRKPRGQSVFTRLSQQQISLAEVAFGRIGDRDLLAVLDAGMAYLQREQPTLPLKEMIARYLAIKSRENLSLGGMANIKKRLRAFESVVVNRIDKGAIRQYLSRPKADGGNLSPTTVVNDRAIINGLFSWAVNEGYLGVNPVASIRRPKTSPARARVLTLDQVSRLIKAATEFKDGLRLPFFALAIYAGIRPDRELHQLSRSNINLESRVITVDAEMSKTRRRHRFVQIQPVLARILAGRDIEAALANRNFRRDYDAVRILAGLMDTWQGDIMRHSFGSYHLAHFKSASETARQMGNSEDIVYQNYYDRISEADAAAFWEG